MHHVDERTLLQIVHDATIMAPPKFLNAGVGGYSAPWSVWTLFKGELKFGNCGEHIGIKEAARVYREAQLPIDSLIFSLNFIVKFYVAGPPSTHYSRTL